MKILFISRSTLLKDKGGDTIQLLSTAEALKKLGVDIDIRLTNEVFEYEKYDLIHFFNIIRPADILPHIHKSQKRYVVSTIFVDYSEYEKKARSGLYGRIFRIISADFAEYIKAMARFILNGEKISSLRYVLRGHRHSIQYILRHSNLLLPNSNSEYHRLEKAYGITQKYIAIPNGINTNLFIPSEKTQRDEHLILCVARIEGRKNQLNLIKALANTKFNLVLIGSSAINQKKYYQECLKFGGPNIRFVDFMEQKDLLDYYQKAKVHVLPSWFETTGLSSLEAAAMGCNIVITRKGDAEEYFGDYAYYCEPDSPESIYVAIENAAKNAVPPGLRELVIHNYNWEMAAQKTLDGYHQALLNTAI